MMVFQALFMVFKGDLHRKPGCYWKGFDCQGEMSNIPSFNEIGTR